MQSATAGVRVGCRLCLLLFSFVCCAVERPAPLRPTCGEQMNRNNRSPKGGGGGISISPLTSPWIPISPLKRPGLTEGSGCPVGTCPEGAKRPAGYQPKRAVATAVASATIEVAELRPLDPGDGGKHSVGAAPSFAPLVRGELSAARLTEGLPLRLASRATSPLTRGGTIVPETDLFSPAQEGNKFSPP